MADLLKFSWLDFKLGFRMLLRYPGLTVVGGLAMAFAIAIGAGGFEAVKLLVDPRLPLDDGDRIVGIRLWHRASSSVEEQALHDFVKWRQEVNTVEELGAFRDFERNLITDDVGSEPVSVAEISASAFRLARVAPLLGRPLVEADEQPGATRVVVIGYRAWETRFRGDPAVVGRTVRLGDVQSTVVGVMPKGFAFPVDHGIWIPFRIDLMERGRRAGPAISVFGRLASGVTLDQAQAELTSLGVREAVDFPDTHEHLRPQVLPYAQSITGISSGESLWLRAINAFFVMLLVLVCGNVALLMFARAATRESEIVVRSALGASRGRIIAQLFAEALVLGGVAVVIGLAAAGFALRSWLAVAESERGGQLPFWFDDSLAPVTVLYAVVLTVIGAGIAGVIPALKVTRRVGTRLREVAAGGGGLQFGGVWTLVIVAQVAVTVAFPATAFFVRRSVVGIQTLDVGFPAEQYLSARLELDQTSPAEVIEQRRATYQELERRLEAEPGVIGVTFTDRLPRTLHRARGIQLDDAVATVPDSALGQRALSASVALDYFDVLGAPILAGRHFYSSDLEADQSVVIVNQSFVDKVMRGRDPIGRRLRYHNPANPADEPGPWYEIVGVVRDLGMIADNAGEGAGVYHPLAPGAAFPVHLALHVKGAPESFAPRVRAVATAVDPTLRLHQLAPLDEVGSSLWTEFAFLFRLLVIVSSIALVLSLAGIYAIMAFTVSRRTREIGIRAALGANPRTILAAIFARPLTQVGLGVVAGGSLAAALAFGVLRGDLWPKGALLVVAYAALMMGICMLACIVPTRRALRIQPIEALRSDG